MSEPIEATQMTDQTPTNGMPEPPFPLHTLLAKKLWTLWQKIIASGVPLLDWDDIEREVQERRGGIAIIPRTDKGRPMANLVVRNLEPRLVDALKQRAVRHGRSAEAEYRGVRAFLRRVIKERMPVFILGIDRDIAQL